MSLDGQIRALVLRAATQFNTLKAAINGKEPTIAAGTAAQYWRGDKTWRTLATDAEPPLPGGGTVAQYLRGDKTWQDYIQATNAGFVNAISTANHVLSGLQTVGGVGVGAGGRVLLNAQTDGKENGIWLCSSGAWVRATDANTSLRLAHYVATVSQGTQIGTSWQTTFKSTDTIGTNNIRFYRSGVEMITPLSFPTPAAHGHHVLDLTNEMPYYYDSVGLTWVSANGVMQRTNAQRLAMTTVAKDVIVRETDTGLTYMWDGAAWQLQSSPSASDLSAGTVPDARLPTRLQTISPNMAAADLNADLGSGWYAAPAGTANSPLPAGYVNVQVINYYGYGYGTQLAFEVSTGATPKMFVRQQQASVWGAWRRMEPEAPTPACMIRKSSAGAQSPASGASATLTFQAAEYDTDGMANLANNRIVVQTAGVYALTAVVAWAANSSGFRTTQILINGTEAGVTRIVPSSGVSAGGTYGVTAVARQRLAVGDLITAAISQTTSPAVGLATLVDTNYRCWLAAELITT